MGSEMCIRDRNNLPSDPLSRSLVLVCAPSVFAYCINITVHQSCADWALRRKPPPPARAYLVTGQAEPAPRDPRGGGFDPGDAAAFAAASAPSLPGVPQGQSGFASRGG